MKQEIKKEVVLQMIWDRHFDLGMEKDLDDTCEDIYNEVFVPLLTKARKEVAKDFIFKVESYLGYNADNETFTKKELLLILAEVAKEQYGVEVK